MGSRCKGHCCEAFTLHNSIFREYGIEGTEKRQIQDMVLAIPAPKENPYHDDVDPFLTVGWYTCKHYVDGNCDNYENRPAMCSRFPYGKRCNYRKCEWDKGNGEAGEFHGEDPNRAEIQEKTIPQIIE